MVVEQAWVVDGQTLAEVPRCKAEAWSWSRRRSRLGSRTVNTLSGRGYWDKTEEEADVDRETMTKTVVSDRS